MSNMLVPLPWEGTIENIPDSRMTWLKELGSNVYCALWLRWPEKDLPKGHDTYIVSFHLEAVDVDWLKRQASIVNSSIILLSDSNYYDCIFPNNVHCYTYYWWHYQLEQIQKWFPNPVVKNIKYKFSNICNRITQSKLLVTTVLLEHAREDSLIKLSTWEGEDSRLKSPNPRLEEIRELFYSKYFGNVIDLDDSKKFVNVQSYSANPWTPVYQNCAVHLTNESFHYSYMQEELGHYCYPGPFITEKTLKCLIGGTGFIPVGQYDTYNTLQTLGFDFSYDFDTAFDQDSGNITRLQKLVNLIEQLIELDAIDLYNLTKTASKYNQEHIYSNTLYKICENHNHNCINRILNDFR